MRNLFSWLPASSEFLVPFVTNRAWLFGSVILVLALISVWLRAPVYTHFSLALLAVGSMLLIAAHALARFDDDVLLVLTQVESSSASSPAACATDAPYCGETSSVNLGNGPTGQTI